MIQILEKLYCKTGYIKNKGQGLQVDKIRRKNSEQGAVVLLGFFAMMVMLSMSSVLYLLAFKENRLVTITNQNYKLEMVAEEVLSERTHALQAEIDQGVNLPQSGKINFAGEKDDIKYNLIEVHEENQVRMLVSTEQNKNYYQLEWALRFYEAGRLLLVESMG